MEAQWRLSLYFIFSSFMVLAKDPTLDFIENKKQWRSDIRYLAKVPGGQVVFYEGKFGYYLLDETSVHNEHHKKVQPDGGNKDGSLKGHFVEVQFVGTNQRTQLIPVAEKETYYNYFFGKKKSHWVSGVRSFEGLLYDELYEGIDLKVYSNGANVKYDFVVSPYADHTKISLTYAGADQMEIQNGDLIIHTSAGLITEKKPVAYQIIDGKKKWIACTYILKNNRISFGFENGYDPCHELVIDPLLMFSTYSGSTADNWGSTATPGERGTLYSSGTVHHRDAADVSFPATPGAFSVDYSGEYDIGILKYDSTGSKLLYASYLGGELSECAHSLVVNSSNELLVFGTTASPDFPTSTTGFDNTYNGGLFDVEFFLGSNYRSDMFIAKFSTDGKSLLAGTLLGGIGNDGINRTTGELTRNYGDELRGDIITDATNNVFISSVTASQDFPALNGFDLSYNGGETDAVVAKLTPDLSEIIWSTFIGGSGTDAALSIKLDQTGNVIVAGGTTSSEMPVTNGAYDEVHNGVVDGWLAKISPDGTNIISCTYTGTDAVDQVYFIDLNNAGDIYVYGQTSGDFPIFPADVYHNLHSGQFLQKFNPGLTQVTLSTVFGSVAGVPNISPTAFLVNECDYIYMAGWGGAINDGFWGSNTLNMAVTQDAFQQNSSGNDFYFIALSKDAKDILYGTYLGGAVSNVHVDGGTSRFEKSGVVYHAVCAGCWGFSDFPVTSEAWSQTNGSNFCNNAAFKFDLSSLIAAFRVDMGGANICVNQNVKFENLSIGGESYIWDFGDGETMTVQHTNPVTHLYTEPGSYKVKLTAVDKGTCKTEDLQTVTIHVFLQNFSVQANDALCEGDQYELKSSGAAVYRWKSADGSFVSNEQEPIVAPSESTTYYVTLRSLQGCAHFDTVQLQVVPKVDLSMKIRREELCDGRPSITVVNTTDSLYATDHVFFTIDNAIVSDLETIIYEFETDGIHMVNLTAQREMCTNSITETFPVFSLRIPNVITPGSIGKNDQFMIQYGEPFDGTTPAEYGYKTDLIIYNRWGDPVFKQTDYQHDWVGDGLPAGVYYYEATIEDHASCKSWLHLIK